jgi:hypothetical protein
MDVQTVRKVPKQDFAPLLDFVRKDNHSATSTTLSVRKASTNAVSLCGVVVPALLEGSCFDLGKLLFLLTV